ncbi:MAG: NUDIX hydrolase [Sphingomicrobium sp.]
MTDDQPFIPAATLVVMRPAPAPAPAPGPPELLVVERSAGMAFAGGAMVFPGGRIDEDDHRLAAALGRPGDAARITAIRETLEESAVAVGLGPVDPQRGPGLQASLLAGEPFAQLIEAERLAIDLDALTPFARWRPAFRHARRFDTLFFLASAPAGDWAPLPQPGECAAAEWASAAAVLARIEAGTASAIFPTKRNLERLARFAGHADAAADAARYPIDPIEPWIEQRGGTDWVCIPANRGYPVMAEPLATAFRA